MFVSNIHPCAVTVSLCAAKVVVGTWDRYRVLPAGENALVAGLSAQNGPYPHLPKVTGMQAAQRPTRTHSNERSQPLR